MRKANFICAACWPKGSNSAGCHVETARPISLTIRDALLEQRSLSSGSSGTSGKGVGGRISGIGGPLLLLSVGLVELHKFGKIELGLLEDLDLLDEDVLEREDLGALLSDLLSDVLSNPKSIY